MRNVTNQVTGNKQQQLINSAKDKVIKRITVTDRQHNGQTKEKPTTATNRRVTD